MAIDWGQVEKDAEAAVAGVLANDWQTVKTAASAQLTALIQVAQSIEQQAQAKSITQAEYESLKLGQQRALSGILHSYAAIGIVIAEQAAAAAWDVVAQALRTAYKLPFLF